MGSRVSPMELGDAIMKNAKARTARTFLSFKTSRGSPCWLQHVPASPFLREISNPQVKGSDSMVFGGVDVQIEACKNVPGTHIYLYTFVCIYIYIHYFYEYMGETKDARFGLPSSQNKQHRASFALDRTLFSSWGFAF